MFKVTQKILNNTLRRMIDVYELEGYGWCRRAFARTASSKQCDLKDPNVACVCASGAMHVVLLRQHRSSYESILIAQEIQNLFHQKLGRGVISYNDYSAKSKRELIKTLRSMIVE